MDESRPWEFGIHRIQPVPKNNLDTPSSGRIMLLADEKVNQAVTKILLARFKISIEFRRRSHRPSPLPTKRLVQVRRIDELNLRFGITLPEFSLACIICSKISVHTKQTEIRVRAFLQPLC